jgi:hypothetical protein
VLLTIWRKLGIRAKVYEWQNPANQVPLEVHRESGPLLGTSGDYVLLVVSDAPYGPHQYLFFAHEQTQCRFVGHIEAWDKYDRPRYRFLTCVSKKLWFVLTMNAGSGTGVSREVDEWYAVDRRGVRFVLSYASRGHNSATYGPSLAFTFDTSSDYGHVGPTERVEVVISAGSLGIPAETDKAPIELFSTRRKAVFVWSRAQRRFVLLPGSEVSRKYLTWLAGEGEVDGLLRFHATELMEVAKNGSAEQKAWLEKFLDTIEGPEALALKAALGVGR